MDEATSALDNISQSYIIKNLKGYLNNKIVVIIAHRLSTIRDVDNIYVLKDGKVIDKGNHKNLLRHSDQYKKLYYNE